MKVVLDTNVIIAAFSARGLCADLLEVCLADHQIFTSGHILDEVQDNLLKKLRLADDRVADIRIFLESVASIVIPVDVAMGVCRDIDDLPVIGTALAASAPVLVTGDKDLLSLESVDGVRMLTPRQFWEMLHHYSKE
jgi:putative PIN family toxin of toxin-antitoxin system